MPKYKRILLKLGAFQPDVRGTGASENRGNIMILRIFKIFFVLLLLLVLLGANANAQSGRDDRQPTDGELFQEYIMSIFCLFDVILYCPQFFCHFFNINYFFFRSCTYISRNI